ncbi:solute carrier family 22 member 20-like [Ambystoma mexicanum]|uniref:solute carrier family 22 member 20-like n=1 Tax=Ambystoma mexicanum TaxID=8296 RepID=UPI0037E7C7BA
MTFNDLLESIGGVGNFQILHTFVLLLPTCVVFSHNVLQIFTVAVPGHHCRLPPDANWTGSANGTSGLSERGLLLVSIPLDGNSQPEKCWRYASPQWRLLQTNTTAANITQEHTVPCTEGWTYDHSVFSSTIVTEWNLVCDQRPMRQVAQTIYMAGMMLGAVTFGSLADRYGRPPLLTWSYLQMALAGTCVAFLPSFISYCFFRFLCGMAFSGIAINTNCLLLEWMPMRGRTAAVTLLGFSFSVSQLILAGVAYGIRDWRWLQFAFSAPFFLFFLFSWLLQESARWLIINGKSQVALRNLRRVERVNGKTTAGCALTQEVLKSHMKAEMLAKRSSHSAVDLVRTPVIRRITCLLALAWFSMGFAYYGVGMDLQKFGFSIYLVQACFGAIDIPAKLVGTAAMILIGRRSVQSVAPILAGLMILINLFIPEEMQIVHTMLSALSKGCLAVALTCAHLYSAELYPTEIRQTGMGFVSMNGRVGSMVSPLVLMIGEYVASLPPLIYGFVAVLAGIGACFLMETRNHHLPDTIEGVENRMKQKPLLEKNLDSEQMALSQQEDHTCQDHFLTGYKARENIRIHPVTVTATVTKITQQDNNSETRSNFPCQFQ